MLEPSRAALVLADTGLLAWCRMRRRSARRVRHAHGARRPRRRFIYLVPPSMALLASASASACRRVAIDSRSYLLYCTSPTTCHVARRTAARGGHGGLDGLLRGLPRERSCRRSGRIPLRGAPIETLRDTENGEVPCLVQSLSVFSVLLRVSYLQLHRTSPRPRLRGRARRGLAKPAPSAVEVAAVVEFSALKSREQPELHAIGVRRISLDAKSSTRMVWRACRSARPAQSATRCS